MKTFAAALAACVVAGCATTQPSESVTVARSRAPVNYQGTVTDYFDIMVPGPQHNRKLAFGVPETSGCALHGSGGRHQGWMVPVIYDTSPGATTAAGAGKSSASGTSAAKAATTTKTAVAKPSSNGTPSATLDEVKISGKGYFFWFSNETIAAVTRRADNCP
ncbi:MAG TPA: hypothetical protein VGP22_14125 [Albitalea sp.]|nr:hypothetical protein [Albitalea sp.]